MIIKNRTLLNDGYCYKNEDTFIYFLVFVYSVSRSYEVQNQNL